MIIMDSWYLIKTILKQNLSQRNASIWLLFFLKYNFKRWWIHFKTMYIWVYKRPLAKTKFVLYLHGFATVILYSWNSFLATSFGIIPWCRKDLSLHWVPAHIVPEMTSQNRSWHLKITCSLVYFWCLSHSYYFVSYFNVTRPCALLAW